VGGFSGFFVKNPSKLNNFWVKGGGQIPQSPPLATRLQGSNWIAKVKKILWYSYETVTAQ